MLRSLLLPTSLFVKMKIFFRHPRCFLPGFVAYLAIRADGAHVWLETMAGDFALNDTNNAGVIVFGLLMGARLFTRFPLRPTSGRLVFWRILETLLPPMGMHRPYAPLDVPKPTH